MFKFILATLTSALVGASLVAMFSAYDIVTRPLAATVAVPDTSIGAAVRACDQINQQRPQAACRVVYPGRAITLDVNDAAQANRACLDTAALAAQTGEFTGNPWVVQIYHTKVTGHIERCLIVGKKPQ